MQHSIAIQQACISDTLVNQAAKEVRPRLFRNVASVRYIEAGNILCTARLRVIKRVMRSLLGIIYQFVRCRKADARFLFDLHAVVDNMPKAVDVAEDDIPAEFPAPVIIHHNTKAQSRKERHHELVTKLEFFAGAFVNELGRNRHGLLSLG
jgi:hypothetical protein